MENDNFKLYWNRSIITDKTIPANRPDITAMNKKTKNTFFIDKAVPNTHSCPKHTQMSRIHIAVPNTHSCPEHTQLSRTHIISQKNN
jgi:hypothetical protein